MGLDVSHDAWHGAYSAFSRFRTQLAEAAGVKLSQMEGFEGSQRWDMEDPLSQLLNHSDCDGIIESKHLKLLAERIRATIKNSQDKNLGGHCGNWHAKAEQFATGCMAAYEDGEDLDFH